ncbi:MAG: hypothetical protein IJM03_06985 [Treponema sp.]|nr:hypothetical protein [Treponema sp.]
MADVRNENYVTEFIFVPLYNRSKHFREFIDSKFVKGTKFGDRMNCTCDKRNNKYGSPDAKTNSDNIVELKSKLSTKLTDYEKVGGSDGNGYERYLSENKDSKLLYVFCDGYDDSDRITGDNVGVVYWGEILDFIRDENINDKLINSILEKVEGFEKEKKIMPIDTYKARLIEVFDRLTGINANFMIDYDKGFEISHFPDDSDEYWDCVYFKTYDENIKGWFWVSNEGIWIAFDLRKNSKSENAVNARSYNDVLEKAGFKYREDDDDYDKYVISQDDFLNFDIEDVANIFNDAFLSWSIAKNTIHSEFLISKFNEPKIKLIKDKLLPMLKEIASRHGLKLSTDSFDKFPSCEQWAGFYFNIPSIEDFRLGFEFDKVRWNDFLYGICWNEEKKGKNLQKNQLKLLSKILVDSGETVKWPSYKYFDKTNILEDAICPKNNDECVSEWIENIEEKIEECLAVLNHKGIIQT